MRKYYTRACNFYHGREAKNLIKTSQAFPLNGKKDIAFDKLEIFSREKNRVKTKLIHIKEIKGLSKHIKKIVMAKGSASLALMCFNILIIEAP